MKARFREDRLFKDVDSIPLGMDFRTVISEAVGQCKVLLAVIGKDWLTMTGDDGRRRIDDPNDYVHIEIVTALTRRIPVIPVLVENTTMPQPADLPDPLRDLAFRNGTPVRSDPDFHHDIDRLCAQLAAYVPQGRMRRRAGAALFAVVPQGRMRRRAWAALFAVILVLAMTVSIFWLDSQKITIGQLTIDKDRVYGSVGGLKPADHNKYKVLLYVHTNQWWIHPEGDSSAPISENGTWAITTEKKPTPANQVAALVVDIQYSPRSPVDDLIKEIPHRAIQVQPLPTGPEGRGNL